VLPGADHGTERVSSCINAVTVHVEYWAGTCPGIRVV